MPVSFTNSKGSTYYLHRQGVMFFFSKEIKEGVQDAIPTGYKIIEMKTGMPVLKKVDNESERNQEVKSNVVPGSNPIAEKKTAVPVPNLNAFTNRLDNRPSLQHDPAKSVNKRYLRVFLCHAHSDTYKVRELYLTLRRRNVDAWFDKEKLLPGQDWELEIRKAVRETDVVIVCLSKQFNQAGFRQKEVRLALETAAEQPEGEIFIIPARLEECDNLESLRKWHWVNLFELDGYEKLLSALKLRALNIGAEF